MYSKYLRVEEKNFNFISKKDIETQMENFNKTFAASRGHDNDCNCDWV